MFINTDLIVFLTSKRKKTLLEEMKVPEGYDGPAVKVVLRDPSPDKQTECFDRFLTTAFGMSKKIVLPGSMGSFGGENP